MSEIHASAPHPSKVVFLFDVDNTLLDNDRVAADLRSHLIREVGAGRADQYFTIFEELRKELDHGIRAMYEDGSMHKLLKRWKLDGFELEK